MNIVNKSSERTPIKKFSNLRQKKKKAMQFALGRTFKG